MNNYEHITQGGIDTLIDFEMNRPVFGAIGEYRKWLESEYIEPDTQERINEDANKTECEYYGHKSIKPDCRNKDNPCPASKFEDSCQVLKCLDLLARQRRLDGVES